MEPDRQRKRPMEELEKIDTLRQRMGIGYKEAKEVLERSGGDLVRALVELEEQKFPANHAYDLLEERGQEFVHRVRGFLHRSNTTKLRLKRGDDTVFEVPMTAAALGLVGALTNTRFAFMGAVGTLAALAYRCTLEVDNQEYEGEPSGLPEQPENPQRREHKEIIEKKEELRRESIGLKEGQGELGKEDRGELGIGENVHRKEAKDRIEEDKNKTEQDKVNEAEAKHEGSEGERRRKKGRDDHSSHDWHKDGPKGRRGRIHYRRNGFRQWEDF